MVYIVTFFLALVRNFKAVIFLLKIIGIDVISILCVRVCSEYEKVLNR